MNVDELLNRAERGDKRAIARLITLVENSEEAALEIASKTYPKTGRALVIGVTGPPGAGKSTLIGKLIEEYRRRGLKVAVLAIDPTSPLTGGALLGDRLRMQRHTLDNKVFIRSLATRGELGGVARCTRVAMYLLDSLGYDVVIIETVGAGQDEVEVYRIAHTVLVVVCPGLGDEIQALKAGVMEVGDIFVVNKADLPGVDEAYLELRNALEIMEAKDGWRPPVIKVSARTGEGLGELVEWIEKHREFMKAMPPERARQKAMDVIESIALSRLLNLMRRELEGSHVLESLAEEVVERKVDPYTAASRLEKLMVRRIREKKDA